MAHANFDPPLRRPCRQGREHNKMKGEAAIMHRLMALLPPLHTVRMRDMCVLRKLAGKPFKCRSLAGPQSKPDGLYWSGLISGDHRLPWAWKPLPEEEVTDHI